MRRRVKTLPALAGEQAHAVDPAIHAALSASAGTGKTQVLTGRVLRLLLSGVAPETILCLTFTKAGAAEMANRIGERLAAWVRMKDSELGTDLDHIGESNDPVTRERARRLFARVLDAPGGLRIQTIHSFAQTLLASFPAEAGVSPGFQPIEGRAEQELARETLAKLLADAEASGGRQLLADVQCLSLRLGEGGATGYLMQCAHAHETLEALRPEAIESTLRQLMGLPDGDPERLLLERCADDRFDCDLLRQLLEANRGWDTDSGRAICANIEHWLASDAKGRLESLGKLSEKLVTKDFRPYKISPRQVALCADYSELVARLATILQELNALRHGVQLAADMAAGLRAGQAFAAAYSRAKRSAGVADYDDLIHWARALLRQPGMGDWVRYKLDQRTDHVLIDESQDTNRDQWDIIESLAEEYFSGLGAADGRHRTIFMVGDFKQAIFRFQGTDPHEFKRAADWVRDNAAALQDSIDEADERSFAAAAFKGLSIDASFRSAQAILDAVDAVIGEVGHRNMGVEIAPNRHRAFFGGRPGEVQLWKPFEAPDADGEAGEEEWIGEEDRLFAAAIARQVRSWADEAPILASTRRPLTPGDVLILVRSRGELASLIVARLFAEGVPVAGIDRLHLQQPLAVRDLLAAITFAVQPLDDLNLGNLLVSPLIGWSQDQLFDLAHKRSGTLWNALIARFEERPDFASARAQLGAMLAMADYTTPHAFLETLLSGELDGRRKLYARLGLSARDPVDELVASALEFERSEAASLDRFLAWFSRGDVEIKRDPSAPVNAVRVMTVHGAKGLEAPVVILADTTADPAKLGGVQSTIDFPLPGGGKVPLIRPRKAERVEPFDTIMAEDERLDLEEHWRLLYVGMTRAMERLVIAGVEPRGARPENCWHSRVERALLGLGAQWEEDPAWGSLLRYRGSVAAGPVRPKPAPTSLPTPLIPAWARTPAPPEARPPRPLAPSAAAVDDVASAPPSAAMRAAARRGTLIHQLLERLPGLEPGQRPAAASRWLERSAGVAEAGERDEIVAQVCRIIADPRFAHLFGPGSLAEAPLAATLPDGRVIAGTLDRLWIGEDAVQVIDFKTGRVPESEAGIPAAHLAQMDAYAAALRVIFPGRDVRSALLYTSGPRLFELVA